MIPGDARKPPITGVVKRVRSVEDVEPMNPLRHACRTVLLAAAVFSGAALAVPVTPPRPFAESAGGETARSAEAVRVTQTLIDFLTNLTSSEEFTAERVGKRFGVSLTAREEDSIYVSPDLGGGWKYGLKVTPSNKSMKRGFNFWFFNQDRSADPTSICVLSLDALRQQLTTHGFDEQFSPSEIGNVDSVEFAKKDVVLTVVGRDLLVMPDGDKCLRAVQSTDGL